MRYRITYMESVEYAVEVDAAMRGAARSAASIISSIDTRLLSPGRICWVTPAPRLPGLFVRRDGDKRPTLSEAQKMVAGGGLVELMTLANGDQLLFDEEGQLKGLDLNLEASELAGQPIVGSALLLQGSARWK